MTDFIKCTLVILSCIVLYTCTEDKTPEPEANNTPQNTSKKCDSITPTYQDDVKAIMDASCAIGGCHDESTAQNNITLETYNQVSNEAAKDRFLCVIKHQSGCTNMPQGSDQLSQEKINTIECWINNNMPEN